MKRNVDNCRENNKWNLAIEPKINLLHTVIHLYKDCD